MLELTLLPLQRRSDHIHALASEQFVMLSLLDDRPMDTVRAFLHVSHDRAGFALRMKASARPMHEDARTFALQTTPRSAE